MTEWYSAHIQTRSTKISKRVFRCGCLIKWIFNRKATLPVCREPVAPNELDSAAFNLKHTRLPARQQCFPSCPLLEVSSISPQARTRSNLTNLTPRGRARGLIQIGERNGAIGSEASLAGDHALMSPPSPASFGSSRAFGRDRSGFLLRGLSRGSELTGAFGFSLRRLPQQR
jgi:hypothetical protein